MYPVLPGGPRNYPSGGSSVIAILELRGPLHVGGGSGLWRGCSWCFHCGRRANSVPPLVTHVRLHASYRCCASVDRGDQNFPPTRTFSTSTAHRSVSSDLNSWEFMSNPVQCKFIKLEQLEFRSEFSANLLNPQGKMIPIPQPVLMVLGITPVQ